MTFLWGTATAAHQNEGDNVASDWWDYEQKGRLPSKSGRACDFWNRWREDFDLIESMGAFRMSVEWARLEPEAGKWDEAALGRYVEMVADLRRRGITGGDPPPLRPAALVRAGRRVREAGEHRPLREVLREGRPGPGPARALNVPENRGAIFSIFNLTDSLGTGVGRFVGGWLAALLTIGPAMTISSLFWMPCGVFLLMLARLFPRDVESLRRDMKSLADQMAGQAAKAVRAKE